MPAKGDEWADDPFLAAAWYRKAAESGCHLSLCSLAERYMKGEGVPKDPKRAIALCHNAVKSGATMAHMPAQVRKVMPATWLPDLDRRVAEHLTRYP